MIKQWLKSFIYLCMQLQITMDVRNMLLIHFGYHPASIMLFRSHYKDLKIAFDYLTSLVELALVFKNVLISVRLRHGIARLILLRTTLFVEWTLNLYFFLLSLFELLFFPFIVVWIDTTRANWKHDDSVQLCEQFTLNFFFLIVV